ncbi:hypothetical protein [Cupriavidus sp. WS]|uniref:hypothetical protein n=1 Tax=Cupriavidus sp. WS TaxID=1312922 RepID=UPI00035F154E|nr:hypothetical protein [Cupriavidus sp. WS]
MGMSFRKNSRVVHVSTGGSLLAGPAALAVIVGARRLGLSDTVACMIGVIAGLAVMVSVNALVARQYRKAGYEDA